MKITRTAATLLTGLALAAAPVLTACSQSTTSSDSSGSAASDSSADSTRSDDKDGQTGKSDTDSGKASASATKNNLPKETPVGHQEVTAPTAGISLAIPEDWQSTPLDSSSDIYYRAPDDGLTPYLGNVNVSKTLVPATSVPGEDELSSAITQIPGGTSTGYSTEQTANGEAAVLNYTASIEGQAITGAVIAAPTKEKGKYAIISINAGSSGPTIDELKTTVIETIH